MKLVLRKIDRAIKALNGKEPDFYICEDRMVPTFAVASVVDGRQVIGEAI